MKIYVLAFMFDWTLIKIDQNPIRLIKSIQIIQGLIKHRIQEIWTFFSYIRL